MLPYKFEVKEEIKEGITSLQRIKMNWGLSIFHICMERDAIVFETDNMLMFPSSPKNAHLVHVEMPERRFFTT